MKSRSALIAETIKRVAFALLFSRVTFAEMLLFLWIVLMVGIEHNEGIFGFLLSTGAGIKGDVTARFSVATGLFDTIWAIGYALWMLMSRTWLVLVTGVLLLIPLSGIVSGAFRERTLTFQEKRNKAYTVRFFYALVSVLGCFCVLVEIKDAIRHPEGSWWEWFNITLLGIFFLQRVTAFSLAACCDEDSWALEFFASQISDRHVGRPVLTAGLLGAGAVYWCLRRTGYVELWALSLTYAYTCMGLQFLCMLLDRAPARRLLPRAHRSGSNGMGQDDEPSYDSFRRSWGIGERAGRRHKPV